MLPSLSSIRPCGPEFGVLRSHSRICPVLRSSRPSLLAFCAVYQSAPSGVASGSCGCEFGVGVAHSVIVTFAFCCARSVPTTPGNTTRRIQIDLRTIASPPGFSQSTGLPEKRQSLRISSKFDGMDWNKELKPLFRKYAGRKHPLEFENLYQL